MFSLNYVNTRFWEKIGGDKDNSKFLIQCKSKHSAIEVDKISSLFKL